MISIYILLLIRYSQPLWRRRHNRSGSGSRGLGANHARGECYLYIDMERGKERQIAPRSSYRCRERAAFGYFLLETSTLSIRRSMQATSVADFIICSLTARGSSTCSEYVSTTAASLPSIPNR